MLRMEKSWPWILAVNSISSQHRFRFWSQETTYIEDIFASFILLKYIHLVGFVVLSTEFLLQKITFFLSSLFFLYLKKYI